MNPKFLVQNAIARGRSRIGTETNLRPRITAFNLAACGWGAILLLTPAPAAGQRLNATLWRAAAVEEHASLKLFPRAPDYRYEGAIVGFVLVGVGTAVVSAGLCGQSETQNCTGPVIGLSLLLGACGALTGALIGGMMPKEPAP